MQFFIGGALDEALAERQPRHDPHRVGAAAESETVYSVARLVVPAKKFIQRQNVSSQSPAECAAEYRERLEGRSADAVVIAGNLQRIGEIKAFEYAPDVGPPDLARGIAGSIRQQNDVLDHSPPQSNPDRASLKITCVKIRFVRFLTDRLQSSNHRAIYD